MSNSHHSKLTPAFNSASFVVKRVMGHTLWESGMSHIIPCFVLHVRITKIKASEKKE